MNSGIFTLLLYTLWDLCNVDSSVCNSFVGHHVAAVALLPRIHAIQRFSAERVDPMRVAVLERTV